MKTDRIRGWAAAIYLALCLLLGGASGIGAGAIANGILQGLAILLILLALWMPGPAVPRSARALMAIGGAFAMLVLLTLIPLPAGLWQALPGRDGISHGFGLLGIDGASLPASLAPSDSIGSVVRLLPPAAMFLLVLQMGVSQRQRLPWVVLGIATVSIGLGAAQLLGGPGSPLRFYEITNSDSPVGFFANANHQATLLLAALPFAGYLGARAAARRSNRGERSGGIAMAFFIGLFLIVGIGIVGSMAGYGLLAPVLLAALLVYRRAAFGRLTRKWVGAFGVLFVLFLGVAFAGPLNNQALAGKLDDNPTSRKVMAATTLEAAAAYFPVGSGLGSFADVYRTFDDPDRVVSEFVNHAHNDYVEVALELGLPGILLILAFFAWWIMMSLRAWRSDSEGANLARAGTVVIFVVLLHSVVDYPIRTSAIAALFAVACALLVPPPAPPARRSSRSRSGGEKLKHVEAV
ncbi:MAG: O-antigen ligase family protein [Allosphingosinicella sp.]|uniref:O-antigen ligase family protein n=1 Tax=Allosphingosinicella sp. TaxID=2823234 RepID=UPI00394F21A0